jgi:hypothetical protein
VTGHHRILVIRLVTSTCAGPEWIGARNQLKYPFALEYPFALADALAYKFGYRRADPATTVAQHAASLTASASRCARSTRLSGPAGHAQRRAACLPGRWTTGHLGRVGVPAEDERRAPGDLPRRSNRGSSARSAADSNHGNPAMPTHIAVHQPAVHTGKPAREEARCENSNTTSTGASERTH